MKQILQHLRTGRMELAELPCPQPTAGSVLIQTRASLISAGTERMLVEFSQANLIQKARQQPDKVKQVLDKIKTDGLMPTLDAVFRKLDEPLPLGYCNAGVVLEVGPGVHDLRPGDRVLSNGNHAEIVCVPRNLCAKIPDGLPDAEAAFTVLGSIALQGIRLAGPTLGERFMVFGMGLLGLLTVQLLAANGCEVLAVDLNPQRLKLAEAFGATTVDLSAGGNPIAAAEAWTAGQGVDGALITASAKTDEIVHQAAESCRRRGRIILVGVVGLNLRRSDFYEKELTFQVSCSYGPGRYDDAYEQAGRDYPLGYVRWTEQRNFEAVLGALRAGRLDVDPMVTHRLPFSEALSAYETIQSDQTALGVLLEYPREVDRAPAVTVAQDAATPVEGKATIGIIGAGGFAKGVLLPALAKTPARLAYLADLNAAAAQHGAKKFSVGTAVTDYRLILDDANVDAVFVVVGHHLHARFVCEALEAGKHVFVEKPLAMNAEELDRVAQAASKASDRIVMVGFNRRFSPHTIKIRKLLAGRSEPLCMSMTVNGGSIPVDHWIQDPDRGGGRIIGEGCHFIDLLAHVADSPVTTVSAMMVGEGVAVRDDKTVIQLAFADGSIGTVNYFSNGSKSYPKETLEVFSDGRVLRMENFRQTVGYGFDRFKKFKTPRQDKGHDAEMAAFVDRISAGGEPLIPFD
ncbi:MAG TPA: bi-domain-containing oxidoreductase, partial [Thermoguttaceae bacterium]|nr:bi-domain-containing oxidoreductase [Thermoguttaceae bacterium]